ncbi:hypothetical protein GCM10027051_31590 [Niabella terrae]
MAEVELTRDVVIGPGRFRHLHAFEPWAGKDNDQEPKYSVLLMIPKNDKKAKAKIDAAIEAAKERGKEKCKNWKGVIPKKNLKSCLSDGDERTVIIDGEEVADPITADHWLISVTSKDRPTVLNAKGGKPIFEKDEIFAGCYGAVQCDFFPYDKGSNGVAAALTAILKTKDGEELGGFSKVAAKEAFAELISDDEDDDDDDDI